MDLISQCLHFVFVYFQKLFPKMNMLTDCTVAQSQFQVTICWFPQKQTFIIKPHIHSRNRFFFIALDSRKAPGNSGTQWSNAILYTEYLHTELHTWNLHQDIFSSVIFCSWWCRDNKIIFKRSAYRQWEKELQKSAV